MENNCKFCSNCGSKVDNGSAFCENCGNRLVDLKKDSLKDENNIKDNSKLLKGKKINIVKPEVEVKKENNSYVSTKEIKIDNPKVLEKSKVKNDNSIIVLVIIVSIICFLAGIIFTICYVNYVDSKSKDEKPSNSGTMDVTITDTGIAEAVNKVYDAVVVVKNYVKGRIYSTGTGFVYDTDDTYAYILTNHHVVSGATEVKVLFTNNNEYSVELVGSDEFTDIALLKIEKKYIITTAAVGDSTALRVGDTTFAVGAPLDSDVYSWTVTRGILSGKDRIVEVGASSYGSSSFVIKVLQTDTAINSGNSGGPLCNANGEVIGVTNMKIASSNVEGMGFAIPIESAITYAKKLQTGESTDKPYLGVSMYDSANDYYSEGEGVYLAAVEAGSPADKAGLKKGDIIIKIEGVEVLSSAYLRYELYKYEIGDVIEVSYKRDGKELKTKVTLGSSK